MRAAAKLLAHFVGEGADVGAGRAFDDEAGNVAGDFGEAIFEEFDFDGLEFDGLIFASEFVGGAAVNFFGGESGRHLLEDASAVAGKFFKERAIERSGRRIGALRLAFGIVSVGGEAKTEAGGVAFAAARIKLDEASGFAEEENEDTGGERIERAEMADLTEAGEVADCVNNVVRSFALGLVDDESAVEGSGLWFAGHF